MPQQHPEPTRAHLGRRIGGIIVDWLLAMIISSAFFTAATFDAAAATLPERVLLAGDPLATLAVWAVQHLLLVSTIGTTIGHRLFGVRVVRDDGAPFVGVPRGLGRTVLLALVIPALIWDGEGRGMHDRAVGTHVTRVRRAS